MNYSRKIYKKDSKGKIRILHVYTQGAELIQESGVLDGKLITHQSTCTPKNVGKSNETTGEQQAVLEAEAKVVSKMVEEYFNTIEEAEESEIILPMLAKDYKKESHKVNFPCFVQPKLDGQRALTMKDKSIISRKGRPVDTMGHITNVLPEGYNFDGELYAHGLSFQENMKLIKKYRPGKSENIKFHVYDIVSDKPFKERLALLSSILVDIDQVTVVPTYEVKNEEEIDTYHKIFLSKGYEGTIVRHSYAGYGVNKRDSQLLKYKDFIDMSCEVIDVLVSTKDPLQGVVHCKNDKGTFGCGMKFSHKEREEILTNKKDYIGRIAEIRFFEYTDDGLPRFPVCYGFRND